MGHIEMVWPLSPLGKLWPLSELLNLLVLVDQILAPPLSLRKNKNIVAHAKQALQSTLNRHSHLLPEQVPGSATICISSHLIVTVS